MSLSGVMPWLLYQQRKLKQERRIVSHPPETILPAARFLSRELRLSAPTTWWRKLLANCFEFGKPREAL